MFYKKFNKFKMGLEKELKKAFEAHSFHGGSSGGAGDNNTIENRDFLNDSKNTQNFKSYTRAVLADLINDGKKNTLPRLPNSGNFFSAPQSFDKNDEVGVTPQDEALVFDRSKQRDSCKKSILEFILDNNTRSTQSLLLHNGDKVAMLVFVSANKWSLCNCLFQGQPTLSFESLLDLCFFVEVHWKTTKRTITNEATQRPLRYRRKTQNNSNNNRVQREETLVYGRVKTQVVPSAKTYKEIIQRRIENENSRWQNGKLKYRQVEVMSNDISAITGTIVY